jgi:DNA mismatch repair protein MutL
LQFWIHAHDFEPERNSSVKHFLKSIESMGRIKKLSEDLINQIAAGEVVERPASVVKELAENAVDAGATRISIELSEGGLGSLCVTDDGCGMSPEDARDCLQRHATSKLLDANGLFAISTKGFRGEAIPSIASVSRFNLQTSEPGNSEGTSVTIIGGGEAKIESCAPRIGTRVEVQDLFFNTPARRKFLKRESTELSHCEEAVTRLALAHPEVGFTFSHGEKVLLKSSPRAHKLRERIADVLGDEVAPHLLEVEERRLGITVSGFVASPEFTLNNARGFYFFVNQRYVRDRGLNSAVQRAFQDELPPGRQPVMVVNIELDMATVDVNVHPQKIEVRFSDPRGVQDAVSAAIKRSLKNAPWRTEVEESKALINESYALAVDRFLSRSETQNGDALRPLETPQAHDDLRPAFGTNKPSINESPPPNYFSNLRLIGTLGNSFWVCETHSKSLVVLDAQAALERIHMTRFSLQLLTPQVIDSLFQKNVKLDSAISKRALKQKSRLAKLGFEVQEFGPHSMVLKTMPPNLESANTEVLISQVLEALESDAELTSALMVMSSVAATVNLVEPSRDQFKKLCTSIDDADFSLPIKRKKIVVHEVHALELKSKNL